jgi:hypothetical protein
MGFPEQMCGVETGIYAGILSLTTRRRHTPMRMRLSRDPTAANRDRNRPRAQIPGSGRRTEAAAEEVSDFQVPMPI